MPRRKERSMAVSLPTVSPDRSPCAGCPNAEEAIATAARQLEETCHRLNMAYFDARGLIQELREALAAARKPAKARSPVKPAQGSPARLSAADEAMAGGESHP